MKSRLLIILFILFCLKDGFSEDEFGTSPKNSFIGKVVRVIDGDTCVVLMTNYSKPNVQGEKSFKIRLADIDAPELTQPHGQQARNYLSSLILNKTVTIEYTKKDFFGRIIGIIYLYPDEVPELSRRVNPAVPSRSLARRLVDPVRKINSLLVSGGHAWHYKKYSKSKAIACLEETARGNRLGLWKNLMPLDPWSYRKQQRQHQAKGEN